ncbi:MAG: RNA polymerase sigma factor [Planctomycetota bacterium]
MTASLDELAARARKGDAAAAEALVEATWDAVCRFAMRMGAQAADAEDIAQDVFLRAFRALDSFRPPMRFMAWLFRIATNRFIDRARRKASRGEVAAGGPGLGARAEAGGEAEAKGARGMVPSAALELGELKDAVDGALRELPETERAVLVLRVYEELPHSEIAEAVGKSVPTVRWHLHRARARLRRMLSDFL